MAQDRFEVRPVVQGGGTVLTIPHVKNTPSADKRV